MGSMANSEDPDEMQHYAAFHSSGSALFAETKLILREKKCNIFF